MFARPDTITSSSLVYNGKNQTASITPSGGSAVPMSYTGPGQSLRTAAGGTSYVNSALGLSAETTGSNTTYYTREPGGALTEERLPGGNYYYLYDGLGSIVALTDSSGAVANTYKYEPYGNVSSSSGSVANPLEVRRLLLRLQHRPLQGRRALLRLGHRALDAT